MDIDSLKIVFSRKMHKAVTHPRHHRGKDEAIPPTKMPTRHGGVCRFPLFPQRQCPSQAPNRTTHPHNHPPTHPHTHPPTHTHTPRCVYSLRCSCKLLRNLFWVRAARTINSNAFASSYLATGVCVLGSIADHSPKNVSMQWPSYPRNGVSPSSFALCNVGAAN